jgi:hypothetical protein
VGYAALHRGQCGVMCKLAWLRSIVARCDRVTEVCRKTALGLSIAASVNITMTDAVIAQTSPSKGEIQFDIPSQPLASALRAYGGTTGVELFYDGSLSIGQRSNSIKGTFTPMLALKTLLRGTGSIARLTDIANTITIVDAPPVGPLHAMFDRYQSYFALLQAGLSERLCDSDKFTGGDQEITLRFSVDRSGVISQAEVMGLNGSDDGRREIVAKIRGFETGKAPPAGLPEPLTMVIYPPSAGETAGCSSNVGRKADKQSSR